MLPIPRGILLTMSSKADKPRRLDVDEYMKLMSFELRIEFSSRNYGLNLKSVGCFLSIKHGESLFALGRLTLIIPVPKDFPPPLQDMGLES